jgi:hypothetical protein
MLLFILAYDSADFIHQLSNYPFTKSLDAGNSDDCGVPITRLTDHQITRSFAYPSPLYLN